MVQSILLGAAKACSSQEHWEKGSSRPFFLRCSRKKAENRKNSCSQYLYSILDSPEEMRGEKITFQSEDTTFPQSKLLTAPSSSLGSGLSLCQAWEDTAPGHTAEHTPKQLGHLRHLGSPSGCGRAVGEVAQLGFLLPCHSKSRRSCCICRSAGNSCGYRSGALAVLPLKQPKIPVAGVLGSSNCWGLTGIFSPQCLLKQV